MTRLKAAGVSLRPALFPQTHTSGVQTNGMKSGSEMLSKLRVKSFRYPGHRNLERRAPAVLLD